VAPFFFFFGTVDYATGEPLFQLSTKNSLSSILMGLVLIAFILIVKTIYLMGVSLYSETNIAHVISEIMFIFILAETVRLLIIYLEFHRVALDAMVEIAIVSVIREIILKGFLHIEPLMIAAASLFIIVLGLLLRFGGIKSEHETYSVYKPFMSVKSAAKHNVIPT
jgi:uncharacterized membrane protein (DUF373 family)